MNLEEFARKVAAERPELVDEMFNVGESEATLNAAKENLTTVQREAQDAVNQAQNDHNALVATRDALLTNTQGVG